MRAIPHGLLIAVGLALAVSTGAGVAAQLPALDLRTGAQGVQQRINDLALSEAENLAKRAGTTVGALSPEAGLAFRRWDAAVRLWKKEKGVGAAPLLAEGVLFDCLGRLQGVKTPKLSSETNRPVFADLAAERPARAAQAFDAALKIDSHLIEARMRAARIRGVKDSRASLELEHIANDQPASPFSYLAAVSRASVAQAQRDAAGAVHWYEQSLKLNPRSTAAVIALSTLQPTMAAPFETLDAQDLYYTYPCTVLTPDVSAALAERMRNVVLK